LYDPTIPALEEFDPKTLKANLGLLYLAEEDVIDLGQLYRAKRLSEKHPEAQFLTEQEQQTVNDVLPKLLDVDPLDPAQLSHRVVPAGRVPGDHARELALFPLLGTALDQKSFTEVRVSGLNYLYTTTYLHDEDGSGHPSDVGAPLFLTQRKSGCLQGWLGGYEVTHTVIGVFSHSHEGIDRYTATTPKVWEWIYPHVMSHGGWPAGVSYGP